MDQQTLSCLETLAGSLTEIAVGEVASDGVALDRTDRSKLEEGLRAHESDSRDQPLHLATARIEEGADLGLLQVTGTLES